LLHREIICDLQGLMVMAMIWPGQLLLIKRAGWPSLGIINQVKCSFTTQTDKSLQA
jgi:hypothetical protein